MHTIYIFILLLTIYQCSCHTDDGFHFRNATLDTQGRGAIERLGVHNYHLCTVLIGQDSGRWLRLWVRWDLDYSYLFSHPEKYSTTWHDTGSVDIYAQPIVTELIFIGQTKVRLLFTIGQPDTSQGSGVPNEGLAFDGYLALGMLSRIWGLWNSVLVTPSAIVFGGGSSVRRFSRETMHRPLRLDALPQWMHGVISPDDVRPYSFSFQAQLDADGIRAMKKACAGSACVYARADLNYTVVISPQNDFSLLPPQMNVLINHKKRLWFRGMDDSNHAIKLLLVDTRSDRYVSFSGGVVVKQSACKFGSNPYVAVLGSSMLRRFVWSYDFVSGAVLFAPLCKGTMCAETVGGIENLEDTVLAIAGLCAWITWMIIAVPVYAISAAAHKHKARRRYAQDVPTAMLHAHAQKNVTRSYVRVGASLSSDQDGVKEPPASHKFVLAAARFVVALSTTPMEWNYTADELGVLRDAVDFIVAVHVLLSVVHFELHAQLALILGVGTAAAIIIVLALVALVVVLNVTGRMLQDTLPLYSSGATQTYVMLALVMIEIPPAAVSSLATLTLAIYTLVLQYGVVKAALRAGIDVFDTDRHAPRLALVPALVTATAVYLVGSLVVMPFVFENIYGVHPNNLSLASLLCVVIVFPLASINAINEMKYHYSVIQVALQHITSKK